MVSQQGEPSWEAQFQGGQPQGWQQQRVQVWRDDLWDKTGALKNDNNGADSLKEGEIVKQEDAKEDNIEEKDVSKKDNSKHNNQPSGAHITIILKGELLVKQIAKQLEKGS